MKMNRLLSPALAGLFAVSAIVTNATTITQDFAADPAQSGWQMSGDANAFVWDSTNQNLRVTWDSSKTNSYFYHPLGLTICRYDDFQIEFDLNLDDCVSGNEPGKTGPMQIAIGLMNFAGATDPGFGRGIYGSAPNIAEFNYFPSGVYDFGGPFPVEATTTPAFISSEGFSYAPTFFAPSYIFELPTNQVVRVSMKFTAKNQSLAMTVTTNGQVLFQPPNVDLSDSGNSGFTETDDFIVDTFAIKSYSSVGNDYDSVLAHGTVDNIYVHIPPVQDMTGALSNGIWQTQFRSRTNWTYTLERSTNFVSWDEVAATVSGNGTNLPLNDLNPPQDNAFYRVRAWQP
ncbi:MAG TPA: hypothetical protein PKA41_09210 [Verrucomicrobiota bacterium]|nr:hypothetical protein [Verrucomicrobiota bacterium]